MLKEIYILDENKKLISIIPKGGFYDDEYHAYLETGADTFDFSVSSEYVDKVKNKNFVLFLRGTKARMFQIMNCHEEETILATYKEVKSETVALELMNSHIRPCTIEGNISYILDVILQDTSYVKGYVSPKLNDIIATLEVEEVTPVYTVLQQCILLFGYIELEFAVNIIDSTKGKYEFIINVYANGERGRKTHKRIEANYNSFGTSKDTDTTEFCSGIIPTGQNGIDIKDVEWLKGNGFPLDKPLGQDFLLDPESHEMFSSGGKYILRAMNFDDTNANDLIWSAYNKLQELKKEKIDYETPIFLTDEEYNDIETGDTVYIVNDKFNPTLQLEARIFELILGNENKCVLSNYKEVKSNIKNSKSDVIRDAKEEITKLNSKKLSEADIIKIQDFLNQLNVDQEEINAMIDKLKVKLNPKIPKLDTISEDTEDYTKIYVCEIDGGLWLGDERIFDIRKNKCAELKEEETPVPTPENPDAVVPPSNEQNLQYAEAVKYYQKFNLGAKQNSSTVANIMSSNNKYKIYTIVKYWSDKFGLDPNLIVAMIIAESTGNPNCNAAAYGLMQAEKSVYFNKRQTIKFLDGSTQTFTPSYSTMRPGSGGNISLNGVTVDRNISNQVMFGCHEFRVALDYCKNNIFAALTMYNMGIGSLNWIISKYVCDKYGYKFVDSYLLSKQSNSTKTKFYEELESLKCNWSAYRKILKQTKGLGTANNIELYLQWYKPINGGLPYLLDKNRNKIGYGVGKVASVANNTYVATTVSTTPVQTSGDEIREKICAKAMEIVNLHKQKLATYDQTYRTWDDTKRRRHPGTFYGCKNPICYDCSSFVTCCYTYAGLGSIVGANNYCWDGSLVKHATAKSGYKLWKVTESGIAQAKPGDIIMVCNYSISESNAQNRSYCIKQNVCHHTIIYMGNRMIAHASKWAYPYEAIRYEKIDYYLKGGKSFFVRPYDLCEADKIVNNNGNNGGKPGENGLDEDDVVDKEPEQIVEDIFEITPKGVKGATPDDYCNENKLITEVFKNDTYDNFKYDVLVPYVFLHFGIHCLNNEGIQNYKNLIMALKAKYINTPIFVAKELHVNSTYTDYQTVNDNIDLFNAQMEDFCNQEDYVIFLDISDGLTKDGMVDTQYSSNGYEFETKEQSERYYNVVKKCILEKAVGSKPTPPPPINPPETPGEDKEPDDDDKKDDKNDEEITVTNKVDITLKSEKKYKYGIVKDLKFELPSTVKSNYYSELKFRTNNASEPTKYKQSSKVYLEGTHCKNGVLIPKGDTEYTISIMPSAPSDLKETYVFGGAVAHRGCKTYNPENSMDAFNYAANNNYKYIEVDVRTTKDGHYILMHDETVDKMTNGTGKVANLTLAQIQALQLDAGSNIANCQDKHIPTFEEFLDFCKSKNIIAIIDMKGISNLTKFINVIKNKGMIEKCITLSNYANVQNIKKINTTIKCMWSGQIQLSKTNIDKAKKIKAYGINTTIEKTTSSMIKYAHDKKLKIGQWTVDKQTDFDNCIKQNVDLITTNKLHTYKDKTHKKYYGVVSASWKGSSYADFKDFIGRDKVVEIAKSYYDKKSTLKFALNTPVDYSNPYTNLSKWKNGSLMNIDSSTFIKLIFMGLNYTKSPYGNNKLTSIKKNTAYNWAVNFGRTAAEQCSSCVTNGWIMHSADLEEFSNIEPGDLIFYDVDDTNNNRFMNVNFVSMCIGKDSNGVNQMIYIKESSGGTVEISNIKDYMADRILVIARLRKE